MTLFVAALVLAACTAGFVVHPLLVARRTAAVDTHAAGLVDAEARKRVALSALKEVELDRMAGKLDDADYRALRTQLEREAMVAIRSQERAREVEEALPTAGGMHACGFDNPEGSRFCAGCGQRLG